MAFSFDVFQTTAIAVLVLFLGKFLRARIGILTKFCIPAPVVGGLIFSIAALIGNMTGSFSFAFDTMLSNVFLVLFFTAIGYSCDMGQVARSGKKGVIISVLIIAIIIFQDVIGMIIATLFGIHPLLGVAAGSTSMFGGHGTAGAFTPLFEEAGAAGAVTMGMAAATFGLVSGGIIGGPNARNLIHRDNLVSSEIAAAAIKGGESSIFEEDIPMTHKKTFDGVFLLAIAMGIGTLIYMALKAIGLTFPTYMGGLLAGVIIRFIADNSKKTLPLAEINCVGEISLTFFVTMSLMTLKLWELASLALPLIAILAAQVFFMLILSRYVVYPALGRDYDAAVMVSGICGFGMGAMANAISNMKTVTARYGPSPTAFVTITAIGTLVCDIANGFVLTAIMNFF